MKSPSTGQSKIQVTTNAIANLTALNKSQGGFVLPCFAYTLLVGMVGGGSGATLKQEMGVAISPHTTPKNPPTHKLPQTN